MTVVGAARAIVDGRRLDEKTHANDLTSRRAHSNCSVSILKALRDRKQIIDADRVVKFEIEYARDGIW